MAQISNLLEEKPQEGFLSNIELNPCESHKAITLRSWKELSPPQMKQHKNHLDLEKENKLSKGEEVIGDEEKLGKGKEAEAPRVAKHQLRIPYLIKDKKDQQEEQFKKFLDMFKTLHINVPFVEALSQMPWYTKFLKELLSN